MEEGSDERRLERVFGVTVESEGVFVCVWRGAGGGRGGAGIGCAGRG